MNNYIPSFWRGKIVSFLGDSVTEGFHTDRIYWQYLRTMLQFAEVHAFGVDDSTISVTSSPMYERIPLIPEDSDLVILFGGSNDFYYGVSLGEWYTLDAERKRIYDTSPASFRSAYARTVLALQKQCPHAQIVICLPMHRGIFYSPDTDFRRNSCGLYLTDYIKCVEEAADIFGLPVIDLYNVDELQPEEPENEQYYNAEINDLLHPNTAGHRIIAEHIAEALKNISSGKE